MAATNPKEPVMPAPTATATLAKVGTNLVLTVTHSVLTETASVSGVVKSGLGAEGTFEGTATFPGSVTVNADGRTWTKDAAASDATKTVFTAPF